MITLINNSYKIAVVGGDNRQELVYKHLKDNGYSVTLQGYKNDVDFSAISSSDIIILPTVVTKDGVTLNAPNCASEINLDTLLNMLNKCNYIICGNITKELEAQINLKNIKTFKYTDCPIFKTLNAVPTAEGAIAIAIEKTDRTVCGSRCLIIGNGCIGKNLAKSLKGLGAKVTVSARKELDFASLWSEGINYINTLELNNYNLNEFDIIFNTVPKRIIMRDNLMKINKDKLIIDLASRPFGFEHNDKDLGCTLLLAPSLPAKYAPKSSAEATIKTIENYILEVVNNGQN